jgi:hypothetical protein
MLCFRQMNKVLGIQRPPQENPVAVDSAKAKSGGPQEDAVKRQAEEGEMKES